MRVIAGKYRSRPLRSLKGLDLRPTSDRLRETLFNVLTAGNPGALEGSTWLDLYAGTGAVGIEALSRGAGFVCFVESSPAAAELIGQNLLSLGQVGGFQVLQQEAARAVRALAAGGFHPDFIFLDPPYRLEDAYRRTLADLAESELLKTTSVVIVEHTKRFDPGSIFRSLARFRTLQQGDAVLSFYALA